MCPQFGSGGTGPRFRNKRSPVRVRNGRKDLRVSNTKRKQFQEETGGRLASSNEEEHTVDHQPRKAAEDAAKKMDVLRTDTKETDWSGAREIRKWSDADRAARWRLEERKKKEES